MGRADSRLSALSGKATSVSPAGNGTYVIICDQRDRGLPAIALAGGGI
jgi:hypothetical protein